MSGDKLVLFIIDFEYGMATSRGFDLANFFWEHCSDYGRDHCEIADESYYPDVGGQEAFLKVYLQQMGLDPSVDLVEKIKHEVAAYLPLVHLQWAHWGLIKAAEKIGKEPSFDYLKYSHYRFLRLYSRK